MADPHELLAELRSKTGTDQMATFAEALYGRSEVRPFVDMPLIAAAYMLGRCDALKQGASEPNGSAAPMAETVLRAARALQDLEVGF